MNISISDNHCFVCGSKEDITMHHGIPQQFKPKNNVTIPVCRKCHDKINSVDYGAVCSYLYKILKTLETNRKVVGGMINTIKGDKDGRSGEMELG